MKPTPPQIGNQKLQRTQLLDKLNSLYPPVYVKSPNVLACENSIPSNHVTSIKTSEGEFKSVICESTFKNEQHNSQAPLFFLEYPKVIRNSQSISFIPTATYLNSNMVHDNFFLHNAFFIKKFWNEHLDKKRNKLNDWQRLQKFVTEHNISIPILPQGNIQRKLDFLEKRFLSSCRKPSRFLLQSSEIIANLKVLLQTSGHAQIQCIFRLSTLIYNVNTFFVLLRKFSQLTLFPTLQMISGCALNTLPDV